MDVVVGPVGHVVLNRSSCRAVVGLQVWWAGVCQVGGNVRQAAKTNASPQNVLLIITEFYPVENVI